MCSHEKRQEHGPLIASLIHEIHLRMTRCLLIATFYLLSGTELSLLREFLDNMLSKGFI